MVEDPADPSGNLVNIGSIDAGEYHSLACKAGGSAWAWGENSVGQLGDGTNQRALLPVQVVGLSNATAVAAGGSHSLALDQDKTVWAWGAGNYGQLGDGTWVAKNTPVQVSGLTDVTAITAGANHSMALKTDRTVWVWGDNTNGQLGDGTSGWTESKNVPIQVPDTSDPSGYLSDVIAIAAGNSHSMVLKADGTVWTWGLNANGQLGDGTTDQRATLVPVTGLIQVTSIACGKAHSLAVAQDGRVWAWGGNWNGQLGDGTYDQRIIPVQIQFPEQRLLTIRASDIVNPGQEITQIIQYENVLGQTLEDSVIVFALPFDFTFSASTSNGIYRPDTHEVFWKVGNLIPGTIGSLAVKMGVPWGLPTGSQRNSFADIGARNLLSGVYDLDNYLDYEELIVVSEQELSEDDIQALLSTDSDLAEFYNHLLSLEYKFSGLGKQYEMSDNSPILILVFFDPVEFVPIIVYRTVEAVFAEKYAQDSYWLFDITGGYSEEFSDGSTKAWGTWAESHSQEYYKCVAACVRSKVVKWHSWIIKQGFESSRMKNCRSCKKAYSEGGNDPEACVKCAILVALELDKRKKGKILKILDDCVISCQINPERFWCEEGVERKICDFVKTKKIQLIVQWGAAVFGDIITTQKCVNGQWKDVRLDLCGAEKPNCVQTDNGVKCVPCETDEEKTAQFSTQDQTTQTCANKVETILPAHDPNAKSVDIQGDILPGEMLTYTIDYENEGQGTAYEVFILDELDHGLDETTLAIDDDGAYSEASRILSWDIGEVPPQGQGFVSFSVTVRDDLPSGTEILNIADVHFPTAFEVTATNPILSIVKAIAADPKEIEAISGQPTNIALSGRDAGQATLSFSVTQGPLYGTLTGTPPEVTYTSMDNFSGQDEFYYTANNELIESDPAKVIITVAPNSADASPPEISDTYPIASAADVHFDLTPVSDDPVIYRPIIAATFSEPIDPITVTDITFVVNGLAGDVIYGENPPCAYFVPTVALNPSTTYQARLTTGIRDKSGNALTSDYVWSFTTESTVNITVTLPDNGDVIDFGKIPINTTSAYNVVQVSSTGTSDLVIDAITKTGTHKADFSIIEDNCTAHTLPPFYNCTFNVTFAPSTLGNKTAQLSISSNDPDGPKLVDMVGEGVTIDTCPGDLDLDRDVDGKDLAEYLIDSSELELGVFATNFGEVNCP
jgi:alpha-tubulin suppressor-like RCC1 family protein